MLSASSNTNTFTADKSSTRALTTICTTKLGSALPPDCISDQVTHVDDCSGGSDDDLLRNLWHSLLDRVTPSVEALDGSVLSHTLDD